MVLLSRLQGSKIVRSDRFFQCNCCLAGEIDSWCFLLHHLPRILSGAFTLGSPALSPNALSYLYMYDLQISGSPPAGMLKPLMRLWILLSSASPGFINLGEPKAHLFKSSSSSPFCNQVSFSHFCPIPYQCDRNPKKRRGVFMLYVLCIPMCGTQAPAFQIPKTTEKYLFSFFKVKSSWQISQNPPKLTTNNRNAWKILGRH